MACCTSPATAAQHSWRDNCYHGASCAKQVIMYKLQDAEFRQSTAQLNTTGLSLKQEGFPVHQFLL